MFSSALSLHFPPQRNERYCSTNCVQSAWARNVAWNWCGYRQCFLQSYVVWRRVSTTSISPPDHRREVPQAVMLARHPGSNSHGASTERLSLVAHMRGNAGCSHRVADPRGAECRRPEHDEQFGDRPRPHPVGANGLSNHAGRRDASGGVARGHGSGPSACSSSQPSCLSWALLSQVWRGTSIRSLSSVSSRALGVARSRRWV